MFKRCVGEGLHPSPDPRPPTAPLPLGSPLPPRLQAATWLTVAIGAALNMSSRGSQTHVSLGFFTGSKILGFKLFLG